MPFDLVSDVGVCVFMLVSQFQLILSRVAAGLCGYNTQSMMRITPKKRALDPPIVRHRSTSVLPTHAKVHTVDPLLGKAPVTDISMSLFHAIPPSYLLYIKATIIP